MKTKSTPAVPLIDHIPSTGLFPCCWARGSIGSKAIYQEHKHYKDIK